MSKLLIENGMIITVDNEDRIFKSGYVAVEDDKITDVGEGSYPAGKWDGARIDADGKAVLPGIVDAHTHVTGSLFKGLLEDNESGFYGLALPMEGSLTPEDVYHISRLGAWECMQAGVTTINDIYHYSSWVARAVDEIGLRAVISQNIVDVNIGALQFNDYTRDASLGEGFLEDNIRLIEEYHGKDNGRITCRMGPHATDTVGMDLAKKIVDVGTHYGVGFHGHLAQNARELALVQESYGLTPVQWLKETGLLGEQMLAAHCIYVNERDIDMLAESGTHMLHCVQGLGREVPYPPTKAMFEKGVHIVLGTDWLTMDPWINMLFGISLNRQHGVPFGSANAQNMLRMSTIEPARALGLGDKIGSLEAGKQADIIFMDITVPSMTPMYHDPIVTIVHNANRHDISDVMIAGKFTVRDRKLQTGDEKEILKMGGEISYSVYNRHKNC